MEGVGMRGYESLTTPAEPAARPRLEPDAVGPGAPAGVGDFAAGVRTHARDVGVVASFATGMCGPIARTIGDFARGVRSHAGTRSTGDFATGVRARDGGPSRPAAVDRSRSGRERQEVHRVAA
jgi:hypothetical protein